MNGCDSSTTSYCEDFLNFTIPFVREDNTYNECEQYEEKNATKFSCNESYFNNITRNCDNWKFDDAVYLETTVSKVVFC